MPIVSSNEMTPREWTAHQWQEEDFERQAAHALNMKRLDIEVRKLEAKWSVLFRIPVLIIKLPVLMILAIAFCIAVWRKHELSGSFWDYMR